MSSYFTAGGGGGRAAYRLESLNLDCIKSPSASWASNSSSPSSTLSESTNSQLTIRTRKPRTPRKRPNQTYQEAAAILSTAYPKIFPTKHLTKPRSKLKKTQEDKPSSALMMPFGEMDSSDFLINLPDLERARRRKGLEKYCLSPGEIDSPAARREIGGGDEQQLLQNQEDFDAESMLDEEMGEGIDSILGDAAAMESELTEEQDIRSSAMDGGDFVYGYPVGLGFGHDYGMGREFRAIRTVDEGDWWRFPCVKMVDLNPNMMNVSAEKPKKKKKKKKAKKKKVENKKSIAELVAMDESSSKANKALKNENFEEDDGVPQLPKGGLILKLDYDDVLNAWADKPSPIAGEELGESDVQARLAQIDLFSENGGIREACVMRYKEKRRTRLFSKKIRYQVRKVNADRRPRMKGRFVRTPNSSEE